MAPKGVTRKASRVGTIIHYTIMKKFLLTGLFAVGGLATHAQTYNYSNNTGWMSATSYFDAESANLNCSLNPLGTGSTTGSITINSGEVEYNEVHGAQENRISVFLGSFYDQQFALDFDFEATSTSEGKAIYLAALTSQNMNPQLAIPMTTCAAPPNMDEIGVRLTTTDPYSPGGLYVSATVYDNGTNLSPSNTIPLSYSTVYYARLKVYGNARGELFIYSNSNRTALVGNFCFEVPWSVRGLRFLQHATVSLAGPSRKTTAKVDNTSIYTTSEPCCVLTWNGSLNYFGSRYEPGIFELIGEDVTEKHVNLDEYADMSYIFSESGVLSVTDWGELNEAMGLKQVAMLGTGKCRCEVLTTVKDVYIGPISTKSAPVSKPTSPTASRQVLRLYPNPTSGSIVVEHDEAIREMALLSAEGVVLETQSIQEAKKAVSLDLSARPAGIYTIRIVTDSGTLIEQVIKK